MHQAQGKLRFRITLVSTFLKPLSSVADAFSKFPLSNEASHLTSAVSPVDGGYGA